MCNHEFKFRKEKNFDTKLLDFPTLSSLPSSLHFDFKEAGEGSVITFRDNAIKTRPLEYSLHPVLDIDCHSSVQISFRPKRLCYVSTDQGLHMYRAEGGRVSVPFQPDLGYLGFLGEVKYRLSRGFAARFSVDVERASDWFDAVPRGKASHPKNPDRERESGGELCRGEREYCYANWILMTCHRSSLPIRGTLGNREFFPFPSYRKVFLLCPFLFPHSPPIHEYKGTVLESLLLFFLLFFLVSLAPLSFSLLVSFVLYSDNMGGGRTVFWKSSNTLMRFRRQIRCKFHECSIPRKRGSRG